MSEYGEREVNGTGVRQFYSEEDGNVEEDLDDDSDNANSGFNIMKNNLK